MTPITIVTGFLGSGKTSLLAHLLDTAEGKRIGVVVNELAARGIDRAYLAGGEHITTADTELVRTVSGGRAGAGKIEEVIEHLAALIHLAEPPEAIVIETSGGSPSVALAEAIARSDRLTGRAALDSVIALVDTANIRRYWADPELRGMIVDQLSAADLIVLNKLDRVGYWGRRLVARLVRKVNPDAIVGTAEFARLPVNEIIGTSRRESVKQVPSATNARYHPVVARVIDEPRPFHPQRLEAWLNAEWPGIIRVKGFAWLATDMDRVYVIDAAGEQREIGMEGMWYGAIPPEERPHTPEVNAALERGQWQDRRQSLVVIGMPDAVEREVRNVRGCLLSGPELDRGPAGWRTLDDPITPQFREGAESQRSAQAAVGAPAVDLG